MRSEREAVELAKRLTEALAGGSILDVGQSHNQEAPTVVAVEVDGLGAVVSCPFCGCGHLHGRMGESDFRFAPCGQGQGYWIVLSFDEEVKD